MQSAQGKESSASDGTGSAAGKGKDISGEEIIRRKSLKEMNRKEKIAYFWDYYHLPALLIIIGVLIVFAIVRDIVTNRPTGFEAELFNAYLFEPEAFNEEVVEALGLDLSKELCIIETDPLTMTDASDTNSMYTMQKVLARLAAKDLNVIAGEEEVFEHYVRIEAAIVDLRTVLSDEDAAFYESRYVWKQVEDSEGNLSDPIAAGIRLDDAVRVQELELYPQGNAVIGIVGGNDKTDRAIAFINYLFGR